MDKLKIVDEQALINAQMEINRAMFERNKDGYGEPVNAKYVARHARLALIDLQHALGDISHAEHMKATILLSKVKI